MRPQVVFEGRVTARCRAEEAFDLLATKERTAVGPGSPVLRLDKEPPGRTEVGSRWTEVVRLGPLARMTIRSVATVVDPPHHLAETFVGPGFRGQLAYRFEPVAGPTGDATVLHQHQEFTLTGPLRRPAAWLVRRAWRPRAEQRLQAIRGALEGSVRPTD
jgi:hypothetical protein